MTRIAWAIVLEIFLTSIILYIMGRILLPEIGLHAPTYGITLVTVLLLNLLAAITIVLGMLGEWTR